MTSEDKMFLFLDVDNTLLDNNCIVVDLNVHLKGGFGDKTGIGIEPLSKHSALSSRLSPSNPPAHPLKHRCSLDDLTVSICPHCSVLSKPSMHNRRNHEAHTTTA